MRRYETIVILRPNSGEEEINRVIETTTQIISDEKGSIIELNKWGMKKLAYLIKKESLGYYVYFDFAATPAAVTEIERKCRIDDVVLKYMTIKTAAAITEEGVTEAIAAITARDASAAAESEETEGETEKTTEAAATTKTAATTEAAVTTEAAATTETSEKA
jgi:small subunit ribosomal protein S6